MSLSLHVLLVSTRKTNVYGVMIRTPPPSLSFMWTRYLVQIATCLSLSRNRWMRGTALLLLDLSALNILNYQHSFSTLDRT